MTGWTLTRRTTTRHGEIAFDVVGDGPPLVLVHGTPSSSVIWRHVAPALARTRRVHVFDLLGFGASERHVDQRLGVAVHGEVLAELIAQWGLDTPAVAGHDIGGATVLRAHLVEGVPVERIALLDAVVVRPWITDRTRQMQRDRGRYADLPDDRLADEIREHLRSATATPLHDDAFAALFGQWDGAEGQALYLRNLAGFDEADTDPVEAALASITVPALVVWGEQDAWLPAETAARVASAIPGAERVVIPGAGHFCMEDDPEAVTAALAAFFG